MHLRKSLLTLSFLSHRGLALRTNSFLTKHTGVATSFLSMTTTTTSSDEPFSKKQKMSIPTSIKIYYWNMSFWRADTLRSALYLQGIPFENITDRQTMNELKEQKKVPFGAFPVMEVDGSILSQTQACAAYVGKLGGDLYPSNDDPLAQANCDEIINGCTDVTGTISATFRGVDDKESARKKLMDPKDGRLYMHLNGLNSVVCKDGSEFACGTESGLTVADLAVWRLYNWFHSGTIDHIPTDWIGSSFPNLKKIYDNVESNEKIQAFKKEYYPDKK